MSTVLLPVYPDGLTYITSTIGIKTIKETGKVVYFNGGGPIYEHAESDIKSFRYFSSKLMDMGLVKQVDIIRTFKISAESAKRWLKIYRTKGAEGFFGKKNTRKKGNVMTSEVIQKAEMLLRSGKTRKEVADELGIKQDTLQKSIQTGKVILPEKQEETFTVEKQSSTASHRSEADSQSGMGMGCTNTTARVEAIKKK